MTTDTHAHQPAVEIKGTAVTLPVLSLRSGDMAAVMAQLQQHLAKAPEFFCRAPVVVDVSRLPAGESLDLAQLVTQLRALALIPVVLRGGEASLQAQAISCQMAVLPSGPIPETSTEPAPRAKPAPAEPPSLHRAMWVEQPVRSGQRIYARGTDLIVTASVGYGAEIMADGHIHVYGTLRGRALAGVQGDTECAIFCRDLQAELVSIAGHYQVSEQLDEVRGKSVRIRLQGTSLIVEPF
ncbi:septum site-determining protein MinC [Methylomarinovum tepidoasis]|uniref:Probable septum site-determining protein MinC n=1 Tax=Methylomarinovum tepidoasis TaxID=2840183 RepID=A0AAU9CYF4_9GAMM|nr:septum site-determining protein MinC [Methylomarinovum sp. IN45]BCX89054.1 septum site-determining protein MinC [Methylomarinovum sp. IN45]